MSEDLTSLRVEGVDLVVRDGDPAHTIVLLHGIGGRASSYSGVMRKWPTGPRLVAWDMPGYGDSAALRTTSPSALSYAQSLDTVLQSLGCTAPMGRVDLIGQSLGALIAGAFAATRQTAVRRLVLVSPALGYKTSPSGPLPPALQKRLTDFKAEGPITFAAKRAPRLVFDDATKPDVVAAVASAMQTLSEAGHTQAVACLASGDLLGIARLLPSSVLLVSGSEDVITPLIGTKTLLDILRQRPPTPTTSERLVEIPRAGHAAYLEVPETFISVISEFLAEAAP